MNAIADVAYVTAVLLLYAELPDTAHRASPYDQQVARRWFQQGVALDLVESALLLGSLRRSIRAPGSLPMPRIRSLAYFAPVVDELQQQPLPAGYQDHLRRKARQVLRLAAPGSAVPQDDSAR